MLLKLISWNVNCRRGDALARQLEAIGREQPDLLCLQEVTPEAAVQWRESLAEMSMGHLADTVDLLEGRKTATLTAARLPFKRLDTIAMSRPERALGVRVEASRGGIELWNVHIPDGSSNGLAKVAAFAAVYARLAEGREAPAVVCGDFNSPREEREDGTVTFWGDRHGQHRELWNAAERSVILGLADAGLPDLFRQLHGYGARDVSWVHRASGTGRRFDHVFASPEMGGTRCDYLHAWREEGLSDHSPIRAVFSLEPAGTGG